MTRISNRLIPNVIIFSIFMCFLGKTASAQMENYDETYYSPAKNEVVVEKYDPIVLYKDTTVRSVEQEQILELEGVPMNAETKAKTKTIVVYDESDYYDYAYTARIRRFDNPVIGIGYYDDYYTNMYWYTYNPNYWGVSIYLGYNWWYPSWSWYYRPYYYSYWGYYDPFFNPYWNPYWDPFYYGHHHHHHHHYGHHHHGHHHHYAWNCNHYYNSLDRGSFYYGPRTYNGATTRYLGGRTENIAYRNSTARYSNRDNRSFGQRYESAMASRTNTSRGNAAGMNTTTRRGGVDINRNAYRSSVTNRTSSSGATGRVTTGTTDRGTTTTGRVTARTTDRGTTTTGRVTTGTTDRTSTTGTTRQVSGSDKYSKPSSVENTRNEQYTRPTTRTSTSSDRVSGSSNNNSNNRSSYSGSSNSKTRSSNTTGTIQRRSSNNSGSINRSSSTNSRSSSVRSSGSSSRSSSYGSSSSRSSSSSSRSSSSSSSRSSRR